MKRMAAGVLTLGLTLTACGSGGGGSGGSGGSGGKTSSAPAPVGNGYGAPTSSAAAPASNVGVDAKKLGLGTVLVDAKGMTLYLFEKDKNGKSACDGACASAWPPLTGTAKAGPDVKSSLLGTTTRPDGTTQITYNNHPLYHFTQDTKPGDTTGQDSKAFGASWYVLAPTGNKIGD